MRSSLPRNSGFTLIELMVVVAIVAILAAIALPSYRDYVIRGNLVEGTQQLAAQRAKMEQYYQDARTYATSGAYTSPCAAMPTAPNWTFSCGGTQTAAAYTITAT
ncbi:MAG: type IV pilin protein, partial [Rudaea sp.]